MQNIRILTYHRIGVSRTGRMARLTVSPRRFGNHLRLLRMLRTPMASLDDVIGWLNGRHRDVGRAAAISFDDGYADLCLWAIPKLLGLEVPTTVFLVADRRQSLWMDRDGGGSLPLMDWAQIADLSQQGVTFGSHSLTHAVLTQLPDDELRAEVADSKKLIEDRTSKACRHFCYPYGSYDERVVEAVQEAGYESASTTDSGSVTKMTDPFRLPRLHVGNRLGTFGMLRRLLRSP